MKSKSRSKLSCLYRKYLHVGSIKDRIRQFITAKSQIYIFSFILVVVAVFLPKQAHSKILIAFIEVQDAHGRIVQLERNGRFAHVAISAGSFWLQSHPYRGVELVSMNQLKEMGKVFIYTLSQSQTLRAEDLKHYLGKPYDREFSWSDDSYYCSELVGKILGLAPEPMEFDSRIWGPKYQKLKGQIGLSPDDIYRKLFVKGTIR